MTTSFVVSMLMALASVSAQGKPTYESCVRAYQAGLTDRAIRELQTIDNNLAKDADRWVEAARAARRPADLEAALLLHTELFFITWEATIPPARLFSPKLYAQNVVLRRLHADVVSFDARTPFLRTWYLLWEAFMQRQGALEPADYAEHLGVAVRAFPDDPEVLLAAGTHFEMRWWLAYDNPQRHPASATGSAAQNLRLARDLFQKAVTVPRPLGEAPLRLGRVLLALGEVDAAVTELRRVHATNDPGLRYVSALLLGAASERRGELDAAAASYDEAATLVAFPQSARLASAYVSHLRGHRTDAANAVVAALGNRREDYDPWWLYTRGYSLQFDRLRQAARGVVKAGSLGADR